MRKLLDNKLCRIYGLLSFIIYSLSFLIGHDDEAADHLLILVKAGMIGISALFFLVACNKDTDKRSKAGYAWLCVLILVHEIMLFAAVGPTVIYIRDYPAILNIVAWTFCSLVGVIRFRKNLISSVTGLFSDRSRTILITASAVIAAIVILMSYGGNGIRFTWDSDTLYQFIYERDFDSLFDAKKLTFHSHVSIVYAYLLVLFKLLFRDIRTGFFVLNAVCITAASFGMTFTLQKLVPKRRDAEYILGNMLFMFSPWVCGISTYHIYDYYIWCLFPLLILFMMKEDWTGFMVTGVMITFSKASGIIVFGGICFGILATDIYGRRKNGEKVGDIVRGCISTIRYWYFLSVAALFYVFFKLAIDADTQFEDVIIGFNAGHFVHIIKEYLCANFLWIFVLLTLAGFIFVFVLKKKELSEDARRSLVIILISDVLFVLFNCLVITYRIPRYMCSHMTTVYICAAVFLLLWDNRMAADALTVILCALTFAGAFYTIDPVSIALFNRIDVGDKSIIDFEMTDSPSLEDSVIYNREYYDYQVVLDMTLSYVIDTKQEDEEIMFSLGDENNTWGFSGGRYSYSYDDNKHYFEEFYDRTIRGLANGYSYDYYDSPDMEPFDMHYIFPQETVEEAVSSSDSNGFFYIYIPSLNNGKEKEIGAGFNKLGEEEFSSNGWKMNCIHFSRN